MASGSMDGPSGPELEYDLGRLLSENFADVYRAVEFDGVVVERLDHDAVCRLGRERLRSAAGLALALLSVNLDHFYRFRPGAGGLCAPAAESGVEWISLADGAPVAARAGSVIAQEWPRVTGADLLPDLLHVAHEEGARVGFLGGAGEMHEALRPVLEEAYGGAGDPFFCAPPRAQVDSRRGSAELAAEVAEAGVDLLCVGLGKPRQEMWIERYAASSGAKLVLPFGAAADFLAGRSKRAPRWMQKNGLEWAFRLGAEPGRLARRYLIEAPRASGRLLVGHEVTDKQLAVHSRVGRPIGADTAAPQVARGARPRVHTRSRRQVPLDQRGELK